MTMELTARAGGPAGCAGVEVEYVDPDRDGAEAAGGLLVGVGCYVGC
jgi:hypothetical protein